MAHVTEDDVRKLARLARLQLTQAEVTRYTTEFDALLEYVGMLDGVDVTGLQPTYQVGDSHNVMRADELIAYQAAPADLLAVAPATEAGQYKTKRVIE